MTKTKWKMPRWMKRYESLIGNTGGNDVTELVNDRTSAVVNLPRAMLAACVKSQVHLLERLAERNMLSDGAETT